MCKWKSVCIPRIYIIYYTSRYIFVCEVFFYSFLCINFATYVPSLKATITGFSILLEELDKLVKIASNLPATFKENIEVNPASGSIQPGKEATVQVYLPK